MAIDAKVSFMNQIRNRLSGTLTVDQMDTMGAAVMDILEHFRMDELQVLDDTEDDMLDYFISAMRVQNRSDKTIERYKYVIGKFSKFTRVPTRRITIHHIRR